MLLHASVPPHSARLVCNQLTALTWKHVSVWRHTQTRHHQNNLPLFFSPPASFSFSSLEAQPPLSPAIYLGTTSAKMGQGRPSFSCLFLSNPAHRYISLAVLCLSESQGHLQPNQRSPSRSQRPLQCVSHSSGPLPTMLSFQIQRASACLRGNRTGCFVMWDTCDVNVWG